MNPHPAISACFVVGESYRLAEAETGQQALRLAGQQPPTLSYSTLDSRI